MGLNPGTRIGPYQVAAQIGAGGMGEVYRATDTNLKRAVALKVLPSAVANDAGRLARFQREAEVLAALNHPNIAQVYGLERAETLSALVMELVEGPTLADRIEQSPIPLDEALSIARQIAEALENAHERGIVHRDLKPANVKVRVDGTVKVLDFGLAKALDGAVSGSGDAPGESPLNSPTITSPAMTAVGVVLGTAAYMSPEQAKGRAATKRSDVWAFGAVLYEMLSGQRAFAGDDVAETLAAVIKSEPDWAALPTTTPLAIQRLLRRCLEKDARRRVPEIAVARFAIDDALAAPADRESGEMMSGTHRARWRRVLPSLAAVVIAAAAASLVTWALVQRTPAPPGSSTRFAINLPAAQPLAISLNDRDLALSPDGTRLMYTAGEERQLMVRAFDRLDPVPVGGVTNARAPFVSPDGRWVGFFDRLDEGIGTGAVREGSLRKVSTAGGAPVVICPVLGGSRGASWGANDTIVFATNDPTTGLLSVPASGGEPTVLTAADAAKGERDHHYPAFLPDSRGVLYTVTADRPEDAQVAVLDLRTGERKMLVRRASHAEYLDTGYLVYIVDGTLWAAPFDVATLTVVGSATPVVERVMAQSGANFTVSRDGTLAYVPAGSAAVRSLVWTDRVGRGQPLQLQPRAYVTARVSPDGAQVAFNSREDTYAITTWDVARQTSARLGFDPNSTNPIWAPNGQFVVFSAGPISTRSLSRHAADGSGTTERIFTAPRNIRPMSISPDGRTLVFEQYTPGQAYDVLAMPMDGSRQPTPLLTSVFDERNATISPDGHWLAYESNESGRDEVYVRPFPDVSQGQYQVSASGGRAPAWARNGRELFFASGTSLFAVAVQLTPSFRAAAPQRLFDDGSLLFDNRLSGFSTVRAYDVAPDGRFLIVKQLTDGDESAASASIIVVQNWAEELKQAVAGR